MVKKTLIVFLSVFLAFGLAIFGWLEYSTNKNYAAPTKLAMAALANDGFVSVAVDDWLTMRPTGLDPTVGFILYPGGNCDMRGYAPLLREIAAAGYLVVAVSMPYDFAIFASQRADEVMAKHPDVQRWVLGGHSMGGVAAASYADSFSNRLAGLILWDSYPADSNSLVGTPLPVTSIFRSTPDGEAPQQFQDTAHLLPDSTQWIPVPGGAHMFFGSFDGGAYVEEWTPKITPQQQHQIIVQATLGALRDMT